MQRVGKFRIKDSFKLTGRGLVVLGDFLEGKVKIGDYLPFNTGTQNVTMQIASVEMADNISTKEYWVGFLFVYKDEQQRNELQVLKLQEQIVDILRDSD